VDEAVDEAVNETANEAADELRGAPAAIESEGGDICELNKAYQTLRKLVLC